MHLDSKQRASVEQLGGVRDLKLPKESEVNIYRFRDCRDVGAEALEDVRESV
jgi:hypothetical protein